MKIGVLTSSRADFGIYIPLIEKLEVDPTFDLDIIAFGTHLSHEHGNTIDEIKSYNFQNVIQIPTPVKNEGPRDIAKNIADTAKKFVNFWDDSNYDYVFALGDRYEMYAAVLAASPYKTEIIHLFAGETTLGAIDDMYRHSISLMSQILVCSTEKYKVRAQEVNPNAEALNLGALNLENYKKISFYSDEEFLERFNIDLSKPTILSTFHPETVNYTKNLEYIDEILDTFSELNDKYQIIITLPNSDTQGDKIRERIFSFQEENPWLIVRDSLGMKGYLSAMNKADFILGNSSSGFIEASFFPKWVINLGNRQDGRILTPNIISKPIKKFEILEAVAWIENHTIPKFDNVYGEGNTAEKIIDYLKTDKSFTK